MLNCIQCGIEFFGTKNNQKYCGTSCRMKHFHSGREVFKPEPYIRNCEHCGIEFKTTDAKCNVGKQNALRATTKEIERKCIVCGTMFKPMQKRGVGRSCCTKYCTDIHRHGKQVADRLKRKIFPKSLKSYKDSERLKKSKEENPDKYRNDSLIRNYGITLQDYNKMLEDQKGVCYICGLPETVVRNKKTGTKIALAVDHCHTKGTVRRLLCARCNKGLGGFKDNIESLENAIKYLKEHSL